MACVKKRRLASPKIGKDFKGRRKKGKKGCRPPSVGRNHLYRDPEKEASSYLTVNAGKLESVG